MKDSLSVTSAPTSERGRPRWSGLAAFAGATAVGAGLLGMRWLIRGNADPFDVPWPLYLQIGVCVLTLVVGAVSGRPFAAACGLFLGLIVVMFVEGRAEYPVASVIALGVHGLLPALAGALCLVVLRRVSCSNRFKECG